MGRPNRQSADAALDAAALERLLASMAPDMVLVGGQALAFWMDRFGIASGDLTITRDGDALGTVEQARDIAARLHGEIQTPRQHERTALVAQLSVPVGGGEAANIDILHQVFSLGGPRKSAEFTRRVRQRSVMVEWQAGHTVRVMNPFDLLDSRVQNAAGLLADKGPHVLTQARWAIAVGRAALLKLAQGDDAVAGRVGSEVQHVVTLARSQAGRTLLREHGIELLDAIDSAALLGLAPALAVPLDKLEAARRQRAKTGRRATAGAAATARPAAATAATPHGPARRHDDSV